MEVILLDQLKLKIYSDGADLETFEALSKKTIIKGFTTNPTLMRKAGVVDYKSFAKEVVSIVNGKPISFEVFTDNIDEMQLQAREIASWGQNVNVKIPVTNTKGQDTYELIKNLSSEGITVNVTAVFTENQIKSLVDVIHEDCPAIISIFAGRIADAGVSAFDVVSLATRLASSKPNIEILWASTREPYNIIEAERANCHIITVPPEMIDKAVSIFGRDLEVFSRETVQMFYNDALLSNYSI